VAPAQKVKLLLVEALQAELTFLFSDIEGSTRLWEQHPEQMRVALARHEGVLRSASEGAQGQVF
jgi:class 3 adenylate cyclase